MKGGLVSGILAIAALQRIGWKPRGSIILQSVIGEETGGVGTLSAVLRGYRADAAIVLEPTKLQICPVGAGAASFRLHIQGLAAHGAMREEGISAIEKFVPMLQAISNLERQRHRTFQHPLFSSSRLIAPISIGKISAGDWPSTVPESLTAEGRFGIFPGEPISEARIQFEQAINSAADNDSWLQNHRPNIEWFEGQFESAGTPLNSPLLEKLSHAHAFCTGKPPEIVGVPYGSDLRFFTNQAKMHAVLFGPGDVALAHSVNEFVPLDDVFLCAQILAAFIVDWCG
jgi:acetylornithine deacetylase